MNSTQTLRLLAGCSLAPLVSLAILSAAQDGGYYYFHGGADRGAAHAWPDADTTTGEPAPAGADGGQAGAGGSAYRLLGDDPFDRKPALSLGAGGSITGTDGCKAQATSSAPIGCRQSHRPTGLDGSGMP